jgi:hypothetical protein
MDGTLSHILADVLYVRLGTASAHVVFDVHRRDTFSTDGRSRDRDLAVRFESSRTLAAAAPRALLFSSRSNRVSKKSNWVGGAHKAMPFLEWGNR